MQQFSDQRTPVPNDLIIGRNAVMEALRAKRPIDHILIARGSRSGSLSAILKAAREIAVPIKEADQRKLDALSQNQNHQGIVAFAAVRDYASVEDLFALARERGEPPFFLIADSLQDPHNLGAILRTAECTGAHGVIVPQRRAVGLTFAVGKASAGAVEYVPVARVPNLAAVIEELKERGVWIYAADFDGEPWCKLDYTGPCALISGNEGMGISQLVRKKADFIVSLPMQGHIQSLNASVASGVLCYEVARQRLGILQK